MIELRELTKRYADHLAVDRLTLTVAEGEVCVLVGPSGCGKTTTMRMVNRLVEPTSGTVLVGGRDVTSMRPEALRRSIGYAIQSVGLFPHLTVGDNVAVVPRLLRWDARRVAERVEELLALVGLEPAAYAGRYPRQLSGGEAQRVGVARALAADPPVLLMDEPFGAVDPLTRERLQAEFARIQRGVRKTVVFVTHDVDEAIRLADRIAVMREGRLLQYATPEEVLADPADKFVHDFMGADRALKRLVRARVSDAMRRDVPYARDGGRPDDLQAALPPHERFVYIVDAAGRLEGWLDRKVLERGTPAAESVTRIDPAEATVTPDTSLRDALSRMLDLGFRSIPVTDEAGRLLGEVGLDEIERVLGPGRAAEGGGPA